MIINPFNVHDLLLEKGLVSKKDILDKSYAVVSKKSRNNNLFIKVDSEFKFFVKQTDSFSIAGQKTIKAEATFHWLVDNNEFFLDLKDNVPNLLYYDYNQHSLIFKFVKKSFTLFEWAKMGKSIPIGFGEKIGNILANLHQIDIKNANVDELFEERKPWVFGLGDIELSLWVQDNNPAKKEILNIVKQNPSYLELLKKQSKVWSACTICHIDAKLANILVESNSGKNKLYLIDWEFCSLGDPLWDIASVLSDFFTLWIISESDSKRNIGNLETLAPVYRKMIEEYFKIRGVKKSKNKEFIIKILRFTGLKLFHSCFENTYYSQSLQPYCAKMLQLSNNILKDEEQAIEELLLNI